VLHTILFFQNIGLKYCLIFPPRKSLEKCNLTRKELSLFVPLFQQITSDLDEALTKHYKDLTLEQAMNNYDFYDPSEKEFLNLIQFQGKNNVSEVKYFE